MSSVDNILEYRNFNNTSYYSPPLFRKTAATTYDFPEHPPKKDKKWSLGSLFRRKKKEESESSSEDEADRKGFLNRRKKKSEKRKKTKQRTTFDHVIIPGPGATALNGHSTYDDNGILSDPTGGFGSYTGRVLTRTPNQSRKNGQRIQSPKEVSNNVNASRSSLGSTDSIYKKNKRGQVKIRAEARRETNICASSSDEDSQASSSRLRSDESINKSSIIDPSHRRSRAARTERYMRRMSKDEELIPVLRSSKSDAESNIKRLILSEDKKEMKRTASRSPMLQNNPKLRVVSQSSGLTTIPPSHTNHKRNNLESIHMKLHKPPLNTQNSNRFSSINGVEPKDNYMNYQRSVSYDADIHRSASPEVPADIIHAQLPLGKPSHRFRNLSLVEQPKNIYFKQPPPPPPRDPWRIVNVQHSDNARPMSYCFERTQKTYSNDVVNSKNNPKPHSFNWRSNVRSTSEDHLPSESSPIPFYPRPSSATSDHPNQVLLRRNQEVVTDQYQYLADKNPRSRKPIFIQSSKDNQNESLRDFWKKKEAQQQQKLEVKIQSDAQKALSFWKQKEEEGKQIEKQSSVPSSPQIFTASTHVTTNIFLPSVLKSDMENADEYRSSPFKPISPQIVTPDEKKNPMDDVRLKNRSPQIVKVEEAKNNTDNVLFKDVKNETVKSAIKEVTNPSPTASERKSSNLEDALDELEAIYNSLRLGDEDLLERAEQRERSIAAKKIMEMNSEVYPGWAVNTPRGAMSDSNFSYEPFDSVDSPKRKRLIKKYRHSDRKNDDMAVRKLNRERCSTISDPKEVISKVSYLLASPLHGLTDEINGTSSSKNHKEPDVTYDDVVFRTIKHANNTLKLVEPQPPFGIPVGPVAPASNSDYLHAIPDDTPKYSLRNKRIPDVVKDDLAYRNLRKDNNREPVLPPLMTDDLVNNNNNNFLVEPYKPSYSSVKKKRAVRSLSANIYNLIQSEPFIYSLTEERSPEPLNEKSDIDNIADAMEIARQILKEKEEKINATRRAFLSDTEAKYKKLDKNNTYLAECRMNFLNNMKSKENESYKNDAMRVENHITSKPPRGMTPDKKFTKEPSLSPNDTIKTISFDTKMDDVSDKSDNVKALDKILNEPVITSMEVTEEQTAEEVSKEQSPSHSESNNTNHQRSSLEDLLTAFAVEAQEASRRIADELKELEKNINPKTNIKRHVSLERVTEDVKHIEEKECGEAIDDKMKDIETTIVSNIEPVVVEDIEEVKPHTSLANIVQTRCDAVSVEENPIITEVHSDSDHDYVNMGSDAEIEKAIPLIDETVPDNPSCKSPFEENKADLIAGFQELKKVSSDSDLLLNKTSSLHDVSDEKDSCGDRGGEECVLKCDAALTLAENNKCAFLTHTFINVSENGSITSYVSGCNIDFKAYDELSESNKNDEARLESKAFVDINPDSILECDVSSHLSNRFSLSESPHSSGFHSNSVSDAEPNDDDINSECFKIHTILNANPLSSLKSPKLVLNSSLNLENKQTLDTLTNPNDSNESSCSTSHPSKNESWRKDIDEKFDNGCSTSKDTANSHNLSDRRHTLNETPEPSDSWCIDPLVLAFACTYGIACSYQFVNVDIITILGLLYVFISFIAALIL